MWRDANSVFFFWIWGQGCGGDGTVRVFKVLIEVRKTQNAIGNISLMQYRHQEGKKDIYIAAILKNVILKVVVSQFCPGHIEGWL